MRENTPTPQGKPIVDEQAAEISREKFMELADTAAKFSELSLGTDGQTPTLFVYHRKYNDEGHLQDMMLSVFSLMVDDFQNEKQSVIERIGAKICQEKLVPIAVFLVSEAWVSKRPDIQPKDDSDRKEVMIIAGVTPLERPSIAEKVLIEYDLSRDENQILSRASENRVVDKAVFPLLGYFARGFFNHFQKTRKS